MFSNFKKAIAGKKTEDEIRRSEAIRSYNLICDGLLQEYKEYKDSIDKMRATINAAPLKESDKVGVQFQEFRSRLEAQAKEDQEKQARKAQEELRIKIARETVEKKLDEEHKLDAARARLKNQLTFLSDLDELKLVREIGSYIPAGDFATQWIKDQFFNPSGKYINKDIKYLVDHKAENFKEFIDEYVKLVHELREFKKNIKELALLSQEKQIQEKIDKYKFENADRIANLKFFGLKLEAFHSLKEELEREHGSESEEDEFFVAFNREKLQSDSLVLGTDGEYHSKQYLEQKAKSEEKKTDALNGKSTVLPSPIPLNQEFKKFFEFFKAERIALLNRIENIVHYPDTKSLDKEIRDIKTLIHRYNIDFLPKMVQQGKQHNDYVIAKKQFIEKEKLDDKNDLHLFHWTGLTDTGLTGRGGEPIKGRDQREYRVPKHIFKLMQVVKEDHHDIDKLEAALEEVRQDAIKHEPRFFTERRSAVRTFYSERFNLRLGSG